jgi:protease IV
MAWILYAVRWLAWLPRGLRRRLRRPPAYVSFLVEGPPPEIPDPPGPRWRRLLGRPPRTMLQLARQFRRITSDTRVRGVVLHLRPAPYTPAQADALAGLVRELRRPGLRVVCWATSYTAATYRIACAADQVLLQPGGMIGNLGIARPYVHLADALARVGIQADILQVSPYKTAADPLTKREMTPEAREMASWLADAHFEDVVSAIAEGRGIAEERARELVDESPYTDLQAAPVGLVDGVLTEEDLPGHLSGEIMTWDRARRRLHEPGPLPPGRYVGLIRIEGMILDGRSRRAPVRPPLPVPFLFEQQTGDLTVVEQARRLARDRRAAAVLLWVDSGGGSATASEAMHAALGELARRKPLVAAMGSVAASGGYYVVTPAHRVFALPGTVTGSIGVLEGKVVIGGLLERLLVNREVVARGRNATMQLPDAPYTEQQRRKMRESLDRVYGLFLQRVGEGRRRPPSALEPIAGGRVWTGRQALEHGLVDELGDLERALGEARRLGGLPAEAPIVEVSSRGETPPLPATAAAIEHALRAAGALNRTGAWLLTPFVPERN